MRHAISLSSPARWIACAFLVVLALGCYLGCAGEYGDGRTSAPGVATGEAPRFLVRRDASRWHLVSPDLVQMREPCSNCHHRVIIL